LEVLARRDGSTVTTIRTDSAPRRVPTTDVGQDVLVIPSDFLPRGGVHIDKRQLSPDGMLSDLIPFPHEDELEVPVILRAIHLREHERAFEGRRRQAELFFQDPLVGGLGSVAGNLWSGGEDLSIVLRY